jgi:hypothetical protein
MDWNSILNWKLLVGSHSFPGPDGGTCINEAAVVVAGFRYRKVECFEDLPRCFSKVLASWAMLINDTTDLDEERAKLLPYVTRLAGSADTLAVEKQRAILIYEGIIKAEKSLALSTAAWCQLGTLAEIKRSRSIADLADLVTHQTRLALTETKLRLLDEAFAIGKQAEPIEVALIKERVEAAKVMERANVV